MARFEKLAPAASGAGDLYHFRGSLYCSSRSSIKESTRQTVIIIMKPQPPKEYYSEAAAFRMLTITMRGKQQKC